MAGLSPGNFFDIHGTQLSFKTTKLVQKYHKWPGCAGKFIYNSILKAKKLEKLVDVMTSSCGQFDNGPGNL